MFILKNVIINNFNFVEVVCESGYFVYQISQEFQLSDFLGSYLSVLVTVFNLFLKSLSIYPETLIILIKNFTSTIWCSWLQFIFCRSILNKIILINIFLMILFKYLPNIFYINQINWRFFIVNTIFLIKKIKNFLILETIVQIHWFLMLLIVLLAYNIISLLPRIMSYTIILVIPTFLALWFFSVVNFLGLHSRRDNFILKFYPTLLPYVIAPGIIWIELISYLMRPVSLSARLFANMVAGHILVHIISGYAHVFFTDNFFVLAVTTSIILCILNFLEYFVAIVQSFLFIFIGALYYKDNL